MTALKLPAFDPETVVPMTVSDAPLPFRKLLVEGRSRRRLAPALGLTNFGVNLTTLPPGGRSSLRHWHTAQDEFVYIIEGEVTLVTNDGQQILRAGMCAGFPKGKADGHHMLNKSTKPARYLEVGDSSLPDECNYPDDDLFIRDLADGAEIMTHKDGTPY